MKEVEQMESIKKRGRNKTIYLLLLYNSTFVA